MCWSATTPMPGQPSSPHRQKPLQMLCVRNCGSMRRRMVFPPASMRIPVPKSSELIILFSGLKRNVLKSWPWKWTKTKSVPVPMQCQETNTSIYGISSRYYKWSDMIVWQELLSRLHMFVFESIYASLLRSFSVYWSMCFHTIRLFSSSTPVWLLRCCWGRSHPELIRPDGWRTWFVASFC